VLHIRQARPEDQSALRKIDTATWTADVSPAPPPPDDAAFFGERIQPADVLVAVRPARAAGRATVPAEDTRAGRRLIAAMLLAAAALDLTRCGLVLATARQAGPAAGLVSVGLAAAALSVWAARRCQGARRWARCAALLIGVASAPQAAASGFRAGYAIPDVATAVLGVLLTVAVLATVRLAGQGEQSAEGPCALNAGR